MSLDSGSFIDILVHSNDDPIQGVFLVDIIAVRLECQIDKKKVVEQFDREIVLNDKVFWKESFFQIDIHFS